MCSNCHKRVAVIFVTKLEKGEKTSSGLCLKCAKELGVPVDNMLGDIYGKMGISPEQLGDMENEMAGMLEAMEDGEDGGAPAIDLPKLFKDTGIFDAFKGEGAYYTLKNLIMFHDCGVEELYLAPMVYGKTAMNYVSHKLDTYQGEGWRMFALMKKVIADNNFDFTKRMSEIYNK